jgi:murein DD-endopeptidase MepM/ murein hydrolase activator NlpD
MRLRNLFVLVLLISSGAAGAQTMYKYRGPDGEWMYTDRAPPDEMEVEVRELDPPSVAPMVDVTYRVIDRQIELIARNSYHAPVEVLLGLDELRSVALPPPDQTLNFVLEPLGERSLITFDVLDTGDAPLIAYHYRYLPGDPESRHEPDRPYRVPFAVAKNHTISQAYPYAMTHGSVDAHYAVDIAMPIGTDIYAARGGTVFEVASTNFRGGLDPEEDGASANLIRILHDDGTYGVYAHLNWNTIRVEIGDTVQRGEYIADSGNTGFSSGPHLHFAVIRNGGMQPESVPIVFEGPNSSEITPERGNGLTAY